MIASAKAYQDRTSYDRRAMGGHAMDWANQPDVFKRYPGVQGVPLPRDLAWPERRLSEIVLETGEMGSAHPPAVEQLAQSLLLSYTHTARARHSGGDFHYRSAPSAGALYPCEVYLGVRDVSGLSPGLYHYGVGEHAAIPLRQGPGPPDGALGLEPLSQGWAAVTFYVTAIFFRSAWKYRDRAYRYHLLDTGHLTEGLILALRAVGLAVRLEEDFDDAAVNAYLGLDTEREVCLCVVRVLGKGAAPEGRENGSAAGRGPVPASAPTAQREVDFPLIREIHGLTSAVSRPPKEGGEAMGHLGLEPGPGVDVRRSGAWPETMDLVRAVLSRRSKRNFVPREVSVEQLGALLACLGSPGGEKGEGSADPRGALRVGLLAGPKVQGLDPGLYLRDGRGGALRPVVFGTFLGRMARVCLDQEWLAHGALHFMFLTDFPWLEGLWGPRGYRYAMMAAGRLGQRLYLAATAMGLGCCGIGAFYDGEAWQLLGLDQDARMLYLVAVGPVKR